MTRPQSFRAYLLPDGWQFEGDLQNAGRGPMPWQLNATGADAAGLARRVTGVGTTQEEAIRAAVAVANEYAAKGKS